MYRPRVTASNVQPFAKPYPARAIFDLPHSSTAFFSYIALAMAARSTPLPRTSIPKHLTAWETQGAGVHTFEPIRQFSPRFRLPYSRTDLFPLPCSFRRPAQCSIIAYDYSKTSNCHGNLGGALINLVKNSNTKSPR